MVDHISVPARGRTALGRGLSSLIPPPQDKKQEEKSGMQLIQELATDALVPGRGQPRQLFEEAPLKELAESIKEHGVLQPLIVRATNQGGYEIVAGERRWRAAKSLGLNSVPCIVTDADHQQALAIALVENLQREDLNPIEEAEGYRRLSEELGYTQERIAQVVAKDRATVGNALRLLRLPPETQLLVMERKLSMGHARALLSLNESELIQRYSDRIVDEGLSVRQTEKLVQEALQPAHDGEPKKERAAKIMKEGAAEREIRRQLELTFGTRVDLHHNMGRGTISIHFSSTEQLNGLLGKLNVAI